MRDEGRDEIVRFPLFKGISEVLWEGLATFRDNNKNLRHSNKENVPTVGTIDEP